MGSGLAYLKGLSTQYKVRWMPTLNTHFGYLSRLQKTCVAFPWGSERGGADGAKLSKIYAKSVAQAVSLFAFENQMLSQAN